MRQTRTLLTVDHIGGYGYGGDSGHEEIEEKTCVCVLGGGHQRQTDTTELFIRGARRRRITQKGVTRVEKKNQRKANNKSQEKNQEQKK
jgi:hypothetical protein